MVVVPPPGLESIPGLPRNRFRQPLQPVAGRYDNPIPTRFLVPIDCSKISAQILSCHKLIGPEKEKKQQRHLISFFAGVILPYMTFIV